jgi:hypothetical protein
VGLDFKALEGPKLPHDLDKETRRDERLEEMRLELLRTGCSPKLAEEMVRDLRGAQVVADLFGDLCKRMQGGGK